MRIFFPFFNPPFLPQLSGLLLNLLWENIWIMLALVPLWDHTSPRWRDDCIINPFSLVAQRDPSTKVPVLSPVPTPPLETPGRGLQWPYRHGRRQLALLGLQFRKARTGWAWGQQQRRTKQHRQCNVPECENLPLPEKGERGELTAKSNKNHTIKELSWNNSVVLSRKGEQKSLFNS